MLMQRAIANIEARLQGVVVGVGAAPSLPLSIEGQAHRLIAEAVSHTNLSQMAGMTSCSEIASCKLSPSARVLAGLAIMCRKRKSTSWER